MSGGVEEMMREERENYGEIWPQHRGRARMEEVAQCGREGCERKEYEAYCERCSKTYSLQASSVSVSPHPLQKVFDDVINQVSKGKGEERHGNGRDFMQQPWVRYCEVAGVGFAVGQMLKKAEEAQGFEDYDRWEKEMLGALAYGAMSVLHKRIKKGESNV